VRSQAKAASAGSSEGRARVRLPGTILCAAMAFLILGSGNALAADPTVSMDPISGVTHTSLHVSGTIEPVGLEGPYYFQYSLDPGFEKVNTGPEGFVFDGTNPVDFAGDITGLRAGATYYVRLVFFAGFSQNAYSLVHSATTVSVLPPTVSLDVPTAITTDGAHLSGEIIPKGADPAYDVSWHFECSPACPGLSGGTIPADNSSHQVSVDVTGLQSNTTYEVRLVAANAGETVSAGPESFTTAATAPAAATGIATDIGGNVATLHGSLNALGLQTTYYFEYGPTAAYDSRVPLDYDLAGGSGQQSIPVEQRIAGLQPGTTYHYRLTAVNLVGTTHGADREFVTEALGGPLRAYEMVSPLDKGGSEIDIEGVSSYQSSPDGNGLVFPAKTPLSGTTASESAPLDPKYFTSRNSSDWSPPKVLDPPQIPAPLVSVRIFTTLAVSEDNTTALVVSLKALAPGASEGDSNLYLRDIETGAYTTIATSPGAEFVNRAQFSPSGFLAYGGGTPDFSQVLFSAPENVSFLPGVPAGGLYEWGDGELRLVSVQSDGTPFPNGGAVGSTGTHRPHYISADGSRVYFGAAGGVYLRTNAQTTAFVAPGEIGAISRNGRFVYYSGGGSLYRYDDEDKTSALLAPSVEWQGIFQTSEDGQYVYFRSTADLAPGATTGQNLYVWHQGQVRLVAAMGADLPTEFMASPNGRYFGFTLYSPLAGAVTASDACAEYGDTGGACRVAYRYDAEAEELTCASCRPDGRGPTGSTHLGNVIPAEFSRHFPRTVLDNGEVLFDTPDSLVAADTNSKRDVYSFDGNRATLISAGKGDGDSQLAEASPSGRDIFFTTTDQLVGRDTDTLTDVYDARVGGGLAAQNPPPARGECIRDDCKATPNAGPELPFGGSEALSGPGNVQAQARKRCGKGRYARRVKGKARCVKQSKSKNAKKAKSNRRQAR
jgi:hypothetical protein